MSKSKAPTNKPTTFRFDLETDRLLDALVDKLALPRVRVAGLAIRRLATLEKVK